MQQQQPQTNSQTVSSVYLRGCNTKESNSSMIRVGAGVNVVQPEDIESVEEDRIRCFLSSKSQIDPSAILGFEDYLVTTYENQPHLSASSSLLVVQAPEQDINLTQNRLMFEAGATETDETNLLDETSRFVKNLNSAGGWGDFQGCTALTQETVRRTEGLGTGHIDDEDQFEGDSRQNLLSSSRLDSNNNNCFIQSALPETRSRRTAFQELTTNASRNHVYNNSNNQPGLLKQSDLTMSGPSFQNESSQFKSSIQNLQNLHNQSSHFITFKPEAVPNVQNPSPIRNPFPSKFRQALAGAEKTKPAAMTETNFHDNVRKESDCYKLLLDGTPVVLSQYSNVTSPESAAPGAQLTMSQLDPPSVTSSVNCGELETGSNFCPGQFSQPKFVVSINQYPHPLGEMPSRIQEDSQEFSCSLANVKDEKAMQETLTMDINDEAEDDALTDSLLNTRESKFELKAAPAKSDVVLDGAIELDNFQALSMGQEDPVSIAYQKEEDMGRRAYISDGSNYERRDDQMIERQILSERQLELILEYADEQTAENLSKQVRSQGGINAYSTMEEGTAPNQSENQIMLGLARALLKQLSSQRDHFSQETIAQLTNNSQAQIEQVTTDQISLIEPDQESAIIDESMSVCSQLTEPAAAAYSQTQDDSMSSTVSSAKELYEMRMRGIRKKREQSKPTKVGKKKTTKKTARVIVAQKKTVTKPVVQKVIAAADVDGFYQRNVLWKQQIDDTTALKKQMLDRDRAEDEVKECTFTPQLIAKEPMTSGTRDGAQLQEFANSQQAFKSSGPVVEDRCRQWAAQSMKKKQQTERILHEISECTFKPTFFAQEFKNRVCPSYDLKHTERVATTAMLTQEFNYFTLKNYLQMNHDSVQDLERLCKLYSSSAGKTQIMDLKKNEPMQDAHSKMLQIAEFIGRSEAWILQVQAKKDRVAEQVTAKREEENTFHPRVDPKSELLHARKLKKLTQTSQNKKAAENQSISMKDASGGLLESKDNDKFYEYYLPKSKPDKKSVPNLQSSKLSKHEKNGNKHPTIESDQSETARTIPSINLAAESRKFNKLIEVLSDRLMQPEAAKSVRNDNKRHVAESTVSLCQQMLLTAQSAGSKDGHLSFCNLPKQLTDDMDDEVMSAEGVQEPIRVFSEQDQENSFKHDEASSQSEETSHFQSIKTRSNRIRPLDLTRVVQRFAQGLLTPTLTDPGHFQGSSEDLIVNQQQFLNQSQFRRLQEEVNLDTVSQETHSKLPISSSQIAQHQESYEQMLVEAELLTVNNSSRQMYHEQAISYEDNKIRLLDTEEKSESQLMSSSMRKHFDFIYKRKLATSIQDITIGKASEELTSTPETKVLQRSVRSRSSSSNTEGLFRKRNSSSKSHSNNSRLSSQLSSRPIIKRRPGMMSSYNIQNMILLEHIPPATATEDTPMRQAKQSLVSDASNQLSTRSDPTICRLTEKLRGLKEKEQLLQTKE